MLSMEMILNSILLVSKQQTGRTHLLIPIRLSPLGELVPSKPQQECPAHKLPLRGCSTQERFRAPLQRLLQRLPIRPQANPKPFPTWLKIASPSQKHLTRKLSQTKPNRILLKHLYCQRPIPTEALQDCLLPSEAQLGRATLTFYGASLLCPFRLFSHSVKLALPRMILLQLVVQCLLPCLCHFPLRRTSF